MDAQITSSVIGGIVGAIAGGIVPYMIYLSTEKKKKKEKQLDYLLILKKEIENLSHKCSELKFSLQRPDKGEDNYISEIRTALENTRIFMTKDLYEIEHTIPHYALYIDSETLYRSTQFLESIITKVTTGQRKLAEEKKNKENGAVERIGQHIDSLEIQLEFIEEECDKMKKALIDKVNYYYEDYQKKYIKI